MGGGKSRTGETADAVAESYDRDLPWYRVVSLNEQKSSKHDSNIHPDGILEHKAAGKTPQFCPCGVPVRTRQVCRDGLSDCLGSGTPFCFKT